MQPAKTPVKCRCPAGVRPENGTDQGHSTSGRARQPQAPLVNRAGELTSMGLPPETAPNCLGFPLLTR